MKIATITLPNLNNDREPVDQAHQYIIGRLLAFFGGFTKYQVEGAWADSKGDVHTDKSTRYEVAYDNAFDDETIRTTARKAGKLAGQLAMYVVIGGKAEIIDLMTQVAA